MRCSAASDVVPLLHIGQLDALLVVGFGRWFIVATDHQLVDHNTRDGTKEWGNDRNPPPVSRRAVRYKQEKW